MIRIHHTSATIEVYNPKSLVKKKIELFYYCLKLTTRFLYTFKRQEYKSKKRTTKMLLASKNTFKGRVRRTYPTFKMNNYCISFINSSNKYLESCGPGDDSG